MPWVYRRKDSKSSINNEGERLPSKARHPKKTKGSPLEASSSSESISFENDDDSDWKEADDTIETKHQPKKQKRKYKHVPYEDTELSQSFINEDDSVSDTTGTLDMSIEYGIELYKSLGKPIKLRTSIVDKGAQDIVASQSSSPDATQETPTLALSQPIEGSQKGFSSSPEAPEEDSTTYFHAFVLMCTFSVLFSSFTNKGACSRIANLTNSTSLNINTYFRHKSRR